jgi:hypothetical protein
MQCGLLPLSQTAMRFVGHIGLHDYEGPAIDLGERERIVRDLESHDALIMRNHGLLTCGATIQQAFNTMYQLELSCRTQVDAMAARTELAMPGPNVLAHTAHLYQPDTDALGYATHEVLNQPGSLADYDAYSDDKPLADAVNALGGGWTEQTLRRAGLEVGSAKVQQLARQANRNLPELRTHDRFGNRIDVVEFHPAYHELMCLIYETQAHFRLDPQGRAWCACGARRTELHVEPRRERNLLPHGNDICVDPSLATRQRTPRRVGAANFECCVR